MSFQNLTGERADVSRTPNLTQGIPFMAQGGVRFFVEWWAELIECYFADGLIRTSDGKSEIRGSLHYGGKSAAFGRDDGFCGVMTESKNTNQILRFAQG